MTHTASVHLGFAPQPAKLRDALSAVVQIGDTLWVANDETTSLERLHWQGQDGQGNPLYGEHTRFALQDYLRLPLPPKPDEADGEEVDVEGLAYHDGYLWLVGSHSLKRKKPETGQSVGKAFKQLAKVSSDGNRYLLARIPLVVEEGVPVLQACAEADGQPLVAAQLRGDTKGNDLMQALHDDPHLGAFLAIPGKDNGFDIEGLAVVGQRLFLGLRGPVLRGWAVILEVEVTEGDDPSSLQLVNIGADERPYRKHFLQLGGLGVRDLCVQGDDLLILAGPTMSLDGPVTVHRWQGGAKPDGESLVVAEHLPVVLDVPYGQGDDHAEGMCLFQHEDGGTGLLVVYDSAAPQRLCDEETVIADLFPLDVFQGG